MSDSTSYRFGRWLGRLPAWARFALLAVVLVGLYRACVYQPPKASPQAEPRPITQAPTPASQAAEAKRLCQESIEEKKRQFADLTGKKQHWEAANSIRSCAERLESVELRSMVRSAEIASHMADINNAKAPPRDRARAMQMLARDYPDVGAKYETQAMRLIEEADRKEQEAERRRKKSEGVTVGMSKDDVLASSWGRPQHINTTTTARGTREQWVYGGRNYLYFENGVLVAIQN